jgi:hypothetical protein
MLWLKRFVTRPWWTMLKLQLFTVFGKPYFKVFVYRTEPGHVAIDAHHNVHFLYELDRLYRAAGSDYYTDDLDEQAKISIYLYDSFGNIAENYIPVDQVGMGDDDIGADVPPMAWRGGEEVKQTVDLANRMSGSSSTLGVKMG